MSKPKKSKNPPIRTSPPQKGQHLKSISKYMKQIKPPKVGGRKR